MSRPATTRLKVNQPLGSMPVLQYCTPDQLKIDQDYQRSLEAGPSQSLIRRIAVHWDWGLCQPLFVARRTDGGLYVVDGQHRLAAARLRHDIFQLPCVVAAFETAGDEAAAFVALNMQRRPLSALDLFKAALAAGDEEAVAVGEAMAAAGLKLANSSNNQAMKPGMIANVGGLQRCLRVQGSAVLSAALKTLAEAYRGQVLRYAGSIFPGIAAIISDELGRRTPAVEAIEQVSAFVGSRDQQSWYRRFNQAIARDSNLKRSRAAEAVFRDMWAERATADEPSASPIATVMKPAETAWCDQCDQRVSGAVAGRCTSQFCSLKVKAA